MKYIDFCAALHREGIRRVNEWQKLDHLARESAHDAHDGLWDTGELNDFGLRDYNDYQSFCASIGRVFVLDNLDLFIDHANA